MPGRSAPGVNSQGSAETNLQIGSLSLRAHGHSAEVISPTHPEDIIFLLHF